MASSAAARSPNFDGDAVWISSVVQHGGSTKLFRNGGGSPSLRVALRGSKENPKAIGAIVRLKFDGRHRPGARNPAGCGYWSTRILRR
jgi:hypothetical protein